MVISRGVTADILRQRIVSLVHTKHDHVVFPDGDGQDVGSMTITNSPRVPTEHLKPPPLEATDRGELQMCNMKDVSAECDLSVCFTIGNELFLNYRDNNTYTYNTRTRQFNIEHLHNADRMIHHPIE
jgi:hypothetical protein